MSGSTTLEAPRGAHPRLVTEPRPSPRSEWLKQMWAHREMLGMLARNHFHVRYKRASLGVLWAVAVPAIQATAMAVIFSRFIRVGGDFNYAAYAVSGVLAWTYFSQTLTASSVAIVDGSDLADKIWFPRAVLVLVPILGNLPAFFISQTLFLPILILLGVPLGPHTLVIVPAILMLTAFTAALSLVLSALHVYFRDVRYLVLAATMVLFYVTPIIYPQIVVGDLGPWLDLNPITGVINLFHFAALGSPETWSANLLVSFSVSIGTTLVLGAIAVEVQRRRDRLFIDLL